MQEWISASISMLTLIPGHEYVLVLNPMLILNKIKTRSRTQINFLFCEMGIVLSRFFYVFLIELYHQLFTSKCTSRANSLHITIQSLHQQHLTVYDKKRYLETSVLCLF